MKKIEVLQSYEDYLKVLADKIGKTASEIKDTSPENLRTFLEKKAGKKMKFTSQFPFIGRGNVLRDSLASSEEINSSVDAILKD